jgi:hypothetical protein
LPPFPANREKTGKKFAAAQKYLVESDTWFEIHRFGREKIFPANRSGREIAGKAGRKPCRSHSRRV